MSPRPTTSHIVVRCDPRGTWRVSIDGSAVSEHPDENAAERSARRHARRIGEDAVIVRDRYHRTRAVGLRPAPGPSDDAHR